MPSLVARRGDRMTTRRVILLHGLWMRPASMALLSSRLIQAGFAPTRLGYASVRGGPSMAGSELVQAIDGRPCHIVAHSLGGLIALSTLEVQPQLPVERIVCLGSPLCGSAAAAGLSRLPVLGSTLGRSARLLRSGCQPWQGVAEVGMVAGRRSIGLGQVLGRFVDENDGTVAVSETRLDGLADHIALPASHTGLLFSPLAARQTIAFLREGRFDR